MPSRISLRIDFDNDRRLGPGKVALLEAIRRTGSISAAGRDMAMAYRKAWLLVDELNRMFPAPVVEAQPGGHKGGGARLTSTGERLVDLYRAAERGARDGAAAALDALAAEADGTNAGRQDDRDGPERRSSQVRRRTTATP